MADVLNNYALDQRLQYTLGIGNLAIVPKLRLFVSDDTIACDSSLLDLTACTAGGYADVTLVPGNWVIDDSTDCIREASYGSVVFTLTDNGGGQTIYGHVVYDDEGSEILWGQTWTTPFEIPAGGGVVEVFPFWNEEQCSG